MNGNTVIEVKDAKKVYKMGQERIKAVDGVSFDVKEGEFCCLVGTSGSGKSTLLNLMAGIEKLTSGDVLIKGQSIKKMSENKLAKFRQEHLGFVFQSYNLLGSMTALENVELPLVFKRVRAGKRRSMAKKMLKAVGLKGRMKHKPKEMSGGQQQRVGIARAFVAKPEIVFADEPTGNLDSHTTIEVMDLIKSMATENHQTVVMVTHDRKLTDYADKVISILDGHIESVTVRDNENVSEEESVARTYDRINGAGNGQPTETYEIAGTDIPGTETTKKEMPGENLSGTEMTKKEIHGNALQDSEMTKEEMSGKDFCGTETSGKERPGKDLSGTEITGTASDEYTEEEINEVLEGGYRK